MTSTSTIRAVVSWKRFLALLICGVTAINSFGADAGEPSPEEIRMQNQYVEYRLQQGEIYKIYVKQNDGVTTIQFPAKISEIAGKNISVDGKGTDFQIAVQPGKNYFSVTAQTAGATGTLSVTYNRQIYILYLIQSDREAYASVVFGAGGGARNYTNNVVSRTPKVTPARLVSLIDMAKKYDALKESYPDAVAGVEQARFRNRYRCGKYDIHLDEAYRFEEEDTIIFKLRLVNLTAEEIKYDKHSFSAHAGDSVYYMSVSDAAGFIPPRSEVYAWFGITSTPRGGRNNLRTDNDWLIALTTQDMHLENIQSVQDELKEKERLAAETAALRERQAKEAGEQIQTARKLMEEIERQQKTLDETKAEIQKSFAELQSKLNTELAAAEADRRAAGSLLEQARVREEAARRKSLEADEKPAAADSMRVEPKPQIEQDREENHPSADSEIPAMESIGEAHTDEAVAAIKAMRVQTRNAIGYIQQKTREIIEKMVPGTLGSVPEEQEK